MAADNPNLGAPGNVDEYFSAEMREHCPYKPGHKITLHPNDPSHHQKQIQAVITRIFEPITHSCVMAIYLLDDIPTTKAGSVAVLKVFDHRFAPQLREYWRRHYPTWSVDREREFRAFAREGGIAEYLAELDSDEVDDDDDENDKEGEGEEDEDSDDDSDEEEEVSPGKGEVFFYHLMRKWYKTEVEVYDTLKDLQGTLIPNLLAMFNVTSSPFSSSQEHEDEEKEDTISKYTSNSAIFLEYIDGFPLKHVTHYCPKQSWQSICDDAINIIPLAS